MNLIWHIDAYTIPAAFSLLPGVMTSREARAMMLAIALQESKFHFRRQLGSGPARGFWQFEMMGGVKGVLEHSSTRDIIIPITEMFCFGHTPQACHEAIQNHDVLAACFARLLLWTDPSTLPSPIEVDKGWKIYLANWRPGKPHPLEWPDNFSQAWQIVKGV